MTLRGQRPNALDTRLKLMLFGPAGVGKTTAAIKMPRPYLIDCEGGARHYGPQIDESEGVVFESNDLDEVTTEVQALLTEEHSYATLVLDPFTTLYQNEVDKAEDIVGSEFGRHYAAANKRCAKLFRLLDLIDMNVIVTCHAKNEYGDQMKIVGQTFDGWKKLDYRFDLVLYLMKYGNVRNAQVNKSRLAGFPDGDIFEWSFDELAKRCHPVDISATSTPVQMASESQVEVLAGLVETLNVDAEIVSKWLAKAKAETFAGMTADQIGKCITHLRDKAKEAVQ